MEPVAITPTDWAGIALALGAMAQIVTAIWVKHVAHNTNSIKDELVAATRKSAFAEGAAEEKRNPTP